ncbi:hypothetical protein CLV28_1862 [Sediminihabitans luteus]|uniref:PKD domain-containing protein n=1 Tax=Sediminihabitans luteus TaxID=1138585 RepID=A0A2M9CR11_9CELL|nr:hypothetical protein [Sediminihabitans luteus]PJJ74366.1 hypothetical protein CLV28_1862 [Sediminihabitans luteus]GIJ00268.1 hypothetical protein Slu03_26450 [Sediminihabitans luteus]
MFAQAAILISLSTAPALVSAVGDDPPLVGIESWASQDALTIGTSSDSGGAGSNAQSATTADVRYRRIDAVACQFAEVPDADPVLRTACTEGEQLAGDALDCAPDEYALPPLFRQTSDGDGNWTSWINVDPGTCLTAADLAAAASREFRRLPLAPSPMSVQPPDGWTLVNVPTITYTTPTPQHFDATLLTVPVEIRATSSTYTWDYGDGTPPVSTTDPGAPHPHATTTHTYTAPVTATITLTTTWTGEFRITGSSIWTPITGTASTTTTAPPLDVLEARSRLVGD